MVKIFVGLLLLVCSIAASPVDVGNRGAFAGIDGGPIVVVDDVDFGRNLHSEYGVPEVKAIVPHSEYGIPKSLPVVETTTEQ